MKGGLNQIGIFKKNTAKVPLVTIATVVFNGERYIEETILSVISQDYSNIEYIIIDGGSTDSTIEIIKRYEDQIDYWVSEPDAGIYDAMNKAINQARGELIGFINSDDILYPNAIKKIANAFLVNVFDYALGPVDIISTDGAVQSTMGVLKDYDKNYRYLRDMPACHQSFFARLWIIKKNGGFNLKYRIRADYDLMIKIIRSSSRSFQYDESLAAFRTGGTSSSYSTFFENFFLLKAYNVSLMVRFRSTFTSIIKLFIYKNFGESLVLYLRKKYPSGRFFHK